MKRFLWTSVLITRCNFHFALQNFWFIGHWYKCKTLTFTNFSQQSVLFFTATSKKQHQIFHKLLNVNWFTQEVMLCLKLWEIPPLYSSNRAHPHPNEELKVPFIVSKRGGPPVWEQPHLSPGTLSPLPSWCLCSRHCWPRMMWQCHVSSSECRCYRLNGFSLLKRLPLSTGGAGRLVDQPVGDWLEHIGLPQYESKLLLNGFDDLRFMVSSQICILATIQTLSLLLLMYLKNVSMLMTCKEGISEYLWMQEENLWLITDAQP